ncbi:MAG: hypothetical protein U0807_18845 [Candidatus Binatia bacterium]
MRKVLFALVVGVALAATPVGAQSIDIGSPQAVTVSARGFYPFSTSANATLQEALAQNKSVTVVISSFTGTKLKIAPAVDGRETGKKKVVKRDTTMALAFTRSGQSYGMSFVPRGTVDMVVQVQPFAGLPCPNPVRCQDDCGANLGLCCEKDSGGKQTKICVQVGLSTCGCAKK